MKTFVFLMVLTSTSVALAQDSYLTCIDSNQNLLYPVVADFNLSKGELSIGYAESLPNMTMSARHVTVVTKAQFHADRDTLYIQGDLFNSSLIVKNTNSVGRLQGWITAPVYTPDGKSERVSNYPVDCLNH